MKMIDIRGGGIRRMFREQRNRYFPLPEYLIEPERRRVEVRIFGKLLDEKYTHALIARPELTLREVMLLDRVQKRKPLVAAEIKVLRAKRLIEGRAPNLYISATVADMTGQQVAYIRNRGMDKMHYKQLIVDLIRTFGPATRQRINELLLPKLPDALSEPQKLNKVSNLLAEMAHKDKTLRNEGSDTRPRWSLIQP